MKHRSLQLVFVLILVSLFFVNTMAQNVDDLTKPYEVDDNTVVLLHLDDNYSNASSQTGDVTGKGNLMLMPATEVDFKAGFGSVLYLDNDARSDSSYLEIPDTDALDLETWTIEGWMNILSIGVALEEWHFNPKLVVKGAGGHCNYWVGPMGGPRYFQVGYERQGGGWDDCWTKPGTVELTK